MISYMQSDWYLLLLNIQSLDYDILTLKRPVGGGGGGGFRTIIS